MVEPNNQLLSDEFSRLTIDLLDQSMSKIGHCLDQLNENQIWWRPDPAMNSIGNLLLHLSGNLRQWGVVPFTLASDRRDRESEFQNDARAPLDEVMVSLKTIVEEAKEQWRHLAVGQLRKKVEIQRFEVTHMHAILHASSHFVGHAHQIVTLTRMQLGTNYKFHWTPNEDRDDLPI
jgi:hypothetical protein